jgi:hypothetical protein
MSLTKEDLIEIEKVVERIVEKSETRVMSAVNDLATLTDERFDEVYKQIDTVETNLRNEIRTQKQENLEYNAARDSIIDKQLRAVTEEQTLTKRRLSKLEKAIV